MRYKISDYASKKTVIVYFCAELAPLVPFATYIRKKT